MQEASASCHPDNLEALMRKMHPLERMSLDAYKPRTDPYLERDKPSGKFRLPDGRVVERDQIVIKERFVTYGPEDFDWLVYAGIITETRDMVFYVIEDRSIRMNDLLPSGFRPDWGSIPSVLDYGCW